MRVFGDNLLVEIKKSEWATADEQGEMDDPRAGSGLVVAIPDAQDILYFGSFNWAFDQSAFNDRMRDDMLQVMERLFGKTVYFEKRADHGMTIEADGKTYAVIKLSKIIGVVE